MSKRFGVQNPYPWNDEIPDYTEMPYLFNSRAASLPATAAPSRLAAAVPSMAGYGTVGFFLGGPVGALIGVGVGYILKKQ